MATADHWFVDLKLNKVNFNGLIMQLEQIFWKISSIFWLFLSESNVEQIYFKIYLRLTVLYAIKHKPWKWSLNLIFLKYFHFTKKVMNSFLNFFSKLGLGMVQLKYQKAKRLKFSFLRFKTLKIGRFCTLNEKCLIPSALWASKKLRRKTSIAYTFGI